jgi:hypothetical protein
MSNIRNIHQLREEISRLRQDTDTQKARISTSFSDFKKSLTPLNLILSIMSEMNYDTAFKSAMSAFERIREYFRKK